MLNLENYKILVVDDFSQMRSTCRRMLLELEPEVIDECANGDDAIMQMRNKKYDIVLCDYNLGEGKDGQQVLEETRFEGILNYASIFMMITGENTKAMVMAAVEYEPDDYLTKPYTKEVLFNRLNKLITRKQGLFSVGEALKEKEYDLALELCDKLIVQHPKNTINLLKIKSNIYFETEQYSLAEQLNKAVLKDFNLPWAHMGLGKICFERNEFTAAEEIFTQILKETPNQMGAYDWLARTLVALGKTEEAQAILQSASELSPQVLIRRQQLADIALQNGDYETAEISSKAAVKLSSGSNFKRPEDFTNLAKILVEKKRDQRAMQCLKQGRDNFKTKTEAILRLTVAESHVHHTVKRDAQAKKVLDNAMSMLKRKEDDVSISTTTSLEIAEACLSYGDKEAGTDIMLEVIENNHENKSILDRARDAFDKAGLAKEGEKMMQKTITKIANINNEAAKLANQGNLEQAIELFISAAKKLPGNKVVNLNAAQALILDIKKNGKTAKRLAKCKKYLDTAQALDSTDKRYRSLILQYDALDKT